MPFCPILRHVLALIALLSGCGHFSASTKIHWPKRQLTSVTKYLINKLIDQIIRKYRFVKKHEEFIQDTKAQYIRFKMLTGIESRAAVVEKIDHEVEQHEKRFGHYVYELGLLEIDNGETRAERRTKQC